MSDESAGTGVHKITVEFIMDEMDGTPWESAEILNELLHGAFLASEHLIVGWEEKR